jgi:hypothetical protein
MTNNKVGRKIRPKFEKSNKIRTRLEQDSNKSEQNSNQNSNKIRAPEAADNARSFSEVA